MGMSTGGGGGMMSEINVTPFVDVMLVLLVIFMVTTPLMVTGMDVDLPRADAPPLETSEDQLVLSITAENKYYINQTEIPADELERRLVAIAKENPERAVFLKADGQVTYEMVTQLMAAAKAAGIDKVGLVTRPGSGVDG
jgi:biopolymer transport protein TolR